MNTTLLLDPADLPDNYADPAAVRQWAQPVLAAAHCAGRIPLLGSPAWCDLSPGDPRTLGAAIRAALAWLDDGTPQAIAARLAAELDEFATAIRRMFAEANGEASAFARERRLAGYQSGPSHAELVRRRNTHRCRYCRTEFYGPVACPTGCDSAAQFRTRAAASWPADRERRTA